MIKSNEQVIIFNSPRTLQLGNTIAFATTEKKKERFTNQMQIHEFHLCIWTKEGQFKVYMKKLNVQSLRRPQCHMPVTIRS